MNSELYTSLVMSARPIAMTGGRTAQRLFTNGLELSPSVSANTVAATMTTARTNTANSALRLRETCFIGLPPTKK